MQFLVMTQRHTDRFTEAEFAAAIPEETAAVREAALVVEATSLQAAETAVDALPLAQRAMSRFTITPLKPYGGFGLI